MRNRFLYKFGARGIFPTGCLELGLIVARFRRTLTLTLTKPSSKPSFAIHYLYSHSSLYDLFDLLQDVSMGF